MKRQKRLCLLGGICLALILVPAPHYVTSAGAASTEPIKIGVLVPQTGIMTEVGNNVKSGLTIAFDEVGWKIDGRDIKMIVEDDEMKPPVALQKARKLVESDRVDLLAGVVHSGIALALRDYVDERRIPLIISCATADAITKEKASKYVFRTSYNSEQQSAPIAVYSYRELKDRAAFAIAQDYVLGHDMADWFKRVFEKLGGKVAGEVFSPLGTTDFAPYLTKIKDVDAVWISTPGSDGIQLIKQYDEYGLKKKIKHLIGATPTYQAYMLDLEKDAALGAMCSSAYAVALNSPENRKFVNTYLKMSKGRLPDDIVEGSYVAGRVIIEGIKNAKGNTADVPKLLDSFRKVKLVTPRGPFSFDANQNSVCDIYIEKVVKKDGKYTKDIIYTYKNVHQDWNP